MISKTIKEEEEEGNIEEVDPFNFLHEKNEKKKNLPCSFHLCPFDPHIIYPR